MCKLKLLFYVFFALAVFFCAVLIEEGSLTTSDTNKRLAIAHAMWAGTSEVEIYENAAVKTPNGGRIQYTQSQIIFMVPFDYLSHYLTPYISKIFIKGKRRANLTDYQINHRLRGIGVVYSFFPLLTVINMLFLFGTFQNMKLSLKRTLAACAIFLVGTTYLIYLRYNTIISIQALGGLMALFVLTRDKITFENKMYLGILLGIYAVMAKFSSVGFIAGYYCALWYTAACEGTENKYRYRLMGISFLSLFISLAIWLIWHKYRFGLFYPTIMQLWAEQHQKFNIGMSIGEYIKNTLSYFFDPAKSVFLHEPFFTVAICAILWKKMYKLRNIFIFVCIYFSITAAIHGLTAPGWGNIFGNRYVNTQAMLGSVIGIYYVMKKIKVRTVVIVFVTMLFLYLLPGLFFNYHYDKHARPESKRSHTRHIPSTIERPVGMYLYLFDKIFNTNYQYTYLSLGEISDHFRSVNRPLIGPKTMKRYLYRMKINKVNYYIFRILTLIAFFLSLLGLGTVYKRMINVPMSKI